MKRLISTGLVNGSGTGLLQTNNNLGKADLFVITLPTGQVLYATEGQWDITVPVGTGGWPGATTIFHTALYGRWSRGAITSEASFGLEANEMSLTCVPQPGTSYPGLSLGILGAAFNGLFDAATVTVYTAYFPLNDYGDVSAGLETKFVGFIEKITNIDRVHVEFECQDPLYLLNQQIPGRVIQSGCPWSFCDPNCALTAATYTVAFQSKSGSTQSTLTPISAFSQAAGYFSQGVVTCTSGANAGLSQTVKLHDSSGNLQMTLGWLQPVSVGDHFSVIKGCNKTATMCAATIQPGGSSVNNLVHFGGMIAVPVPLDAV
jgi:uncharacterized phage protein (TIGR02218 family)